MKLGSALALASILVGALAATANAQPPTVTCEVYELWATHGKGGVDAQIPKLLGTRLQNDLKYTEYKLLSNKSVKLEAKKPETLKLAKGSAKLELVEIVNKSQARLNVDFSPAPKGKQTTANPTMSAADWQSIVAKTSNTPTADAHILSLSCK